MIIKQPLSVSRPSRKSATTPQTVSQTSVPPADSVSLSSSSFNLRAVLAETAAEAASLAKKLPEHVPNEVLVKMPEGTTSEQMKEFAADYGGKIVHQFRVPESIKKDFGGEMVWLKMDGLSTSQAMAAMDKDQRVLYAASNDVGELVEPVDEHEVELTNPSPRRTPNDLHEDQYAIEKMSLPQAWDVTTGSRQGPIIALLDTGVDYNHPDLKDNIWTNPRETANGKDDDGNGYVDDIHGINSVRGTGDPMDTGSHGTHCAGIIGATGNNGEGVVGANWEAQILPISALGRGSTGARVRALFYATENGAVITSNSWGYTKTNAAEADAFRVSPQLHVCASGNDGADNDQTGDFPSGLPDPKILSVASTDDRDQLSRFSNYGAESVDVAAPGSSILSTIPRGGYGKKSGTSMSTPYVAGVAGLIASRHPDLSIAQIKTRLINSVDRLPQFEGKMTSDGRINAARAVEVDEQAPPAVGDFRGQATSVNSVQLNWIASSDDPCPDDAKDCTPEAASRYELRVREEGESFEQGRAIRTAWPKSAGTQEQMSASIFPSGTERVVTFGLQAEDNVGNRSELRTSAVTIPAAQVAFEDDGSSNTAWQADGFSRVQVDGRNVWTDSPEGNYENRTKASLTSAPIDLSAMQNSTVAMEVSHDLERGHDKVYLEYAEAGSDNPSWSTLKTLHGRSEKTTHHVDISQLDGKKIQLRLRLDTDESVTADGFTLNRFAVYSDT